MALPLGMEVTHGDVAAVERLFAAFGAEDYVGEDVSQLEHALQAAKCARDAGADDEVIAAALLHDVGHMLGLRAGSDVPPTRDEEAKDADSGRAAQHGVARMGVYGVVNHEGLGGAWCAALGLPARVAELVRSHVSAKRYLCWKNPAYLAKLSHASTQTLRYQGGPMTDAEAAAFEAHPDMRIILLMRTWDEAAKVRGMPTPPLESYMPMLAALCARTK